MLCADEKSQIQALDRTQPGLPLKKGRCGTMTHDYKRNGTATLFAAMSALDGSVISMCDDRRRHQEWLRFLRVIDDLTPTDTEQRLRRNISRDVEELIMAIGDYIDKHNDKPKPFVWTAKAADILEKVKRARTALDNG